MNEKSYPRIGETVLEKTLPNGLKIFIVPKPQHRKKSRRAKSACPVLKVSS